MDTEVELAYKFHEIYERLAPSFGYETRTETRHFDPNSPNGKLMIAVCKEILASDPLRIQLAELAHVIMGEVPGEPSQNEGAIATAIRVLRKYTTPVDGADPKKIMDLQARVLDFNSLQLPGQPRSMHMGTSNLVNDLWTQVMKLNIKKE